MCGGSTGPVPPREPVGGGCLPRTRRPRDPALPRSEKYVLFGPGKPDLAVPRVVMAWRRAGNARGRFLRASFRRTSARGTVSHRGAGRATTRRHRRGGSGTRTPSSGTRPSAGSAMSHGRARAAAASLSRHVRTAGAAHGAGRRGRSRRRDAKEQRCFPARGCASGRAASLRTRVWFKIDFEPGARFV